MHGRIPPKGMCSRSRDLFKFWEMSGNISQTVQLKTNRKSYDAYRMAPIRVTFSDLEGHFCCLKPLCPSVTVVCFHDGALAGYCAVSSTTLVAVDVG